MDPKRMDLNLSCFSRNICEFSVANLNLQLKDLTI